MRLPSIDELKQRGSRLLNTISSPARKLVNTELNLARQAGRGVQNYFAPTQNVRVRDFAREVPEATRHVGTQLARAIPRGIGTATATFSKPFTGVDTYDPKINPATKFVFGNEPIRDVFARGTGTLNSFGASPENQRRYGGAVGLAGTFASLLPNTDGASAAITAKTALPIIGKSLAGVSMAGLKRGATDFNPKIVQKAIEPVIDSFPLLSGRKPIAGVNDARPSELKNVRVGQLEKLGKTVTENGDTGGKIPVNVSLDSIDTSNISKIEENLFGHSAMPIPNGGKTGVGSIGNFNRGVENRFDQVASEALSSENPLIRGLATGLRGFFGGLGKTQGLTNNLREAKGSMDYGAELSQQLRSVIPEGSELAQKLHSNLDPSLYEGAVAKLDQDETGLLNTLKSVSNFINDTNFKNGFLSEEQWLKNRDGKYIARMYEKTELPKEIQKYYGSAKAKLDLNPFKKREELTDWKIDNSIKDPVYLIGKRLEQTIFNDATKKLFDQLATTHSHVVSDVARPGFTQISEHRAYGSLSGKFVRKDVMEDIQGYFGSNKFVDGAYDLLKAYDNHPIRQFYKKLLTVFNPVAQVGNNTGNILMAHLGGHNPIEFTKEFTKVGKELASNSPLVLNLKRNGVLGSTVHRGELQPFVDALKSETSDPNVLLQIDKLATQAYRNTDDRAKLASVKIWLKKGYSYDEAVKRTMDSFQNYYTVGFFYNIASKIPIIGNPFVKFKGALMSIIKNSMRDHPIRLATTIGIVVLLGEVASRLSGETAQDKQTREGRLGAPHIPFTNTSLEFQTPYGAVNTGRMLGMYSPNQTDEEAGDLSSFMPLKNLTNPKNFSDPVLGPFAQVATDTDFRGKSIKDPNQGKYDSISELTPFEQRLNQAKFLQRAATGPAVNSVIDTGNSIMGNEDYYGRVRSPKQAISSALGVKVEDFGPKQAEARREKDAQFEQKNKDDVKKAVNSVNKKLLNGSIDQNTASKRINELLNSPDSKTNAYIGDKRIIQSQSGGFNYIDSSGDLKNVDTRKKAEEAIFKMDFEQSDKTFSEFGNKVYRKDYDGVAHATSKAIYASELANAKLDAAYDAKNYPEWKELAQVRYNALKEQLNDPALDELEKEKVQNSIRTLVDKANKFAKQGGFKSGRGGKKGKKITLKTGKLQTNQNKTHKAGGGYAPTVSFRTPKMSEPTFTIGKGFKVK